MLKQEAILEFKQIYFEETGQALTDIEAAEQANSMFNLFKVLLKNNSLDKQGKEMPL
jgi:hypothetical protein